MTYIEYDTQTGRIVRRAWGEQPDWFTTPRNGCETVHLPSLTQSSVQQLITEANAIHDAGVDYESETKMSVGYLCYDTDTGEVVPEAEIRQRPTVE